jgi:hypothetical protein
MAKNAHRIFLLSPANLSGRRAHILLREEASFELATRLRATGAPLGEVFSFVSGLYFRGKLAYANAFSQPGRAATESIFVITATHGLASPHESVTHRRLQEMSQVPIHCSDLRYMAPLERDLARLSARMGRLDEVILLGSVATPKYLEPLTAAFGKRLMIPAEFIGRGDMSRGAMMLRAVRENVQLKYISAGDLPPKTPGTSAKTRKRSSAVTPKKSKRHPSPSAAGSG